MGMRLNNTAIHTCGQKKNFRWGVLSSLILQVHEIWILRQMEDINSFTISGGKYCN